MCAVSGIPGLRRGNYEVGAGVKMPKVIKPPIISLGLGAHEGPLLSVFDSFLKEHYLTVLYRVALFIADLAGDRTFGQQAKHKILRDFIGTDRDRRGEILMLVECLSRKSCAFGDQHIFTGAEVFEQKAAIFAGSHRLQVGEWIAAAVRTNRYLGQCKPFTGLL